MSLGQNWLRCVYGHREKENEICLYLRVMKMPLVHLWRSRVWLADIFVLFPKGLGYNLDSKRYNSSSLSTKCMSKCLSPTKPLSKILI